MIKNSLFLLLGLFAFSACDKDDDGEPIDGIADFTKQFKIVGEAKDTVDGKSIDCNCDLYIELDQVPTRSKKEYTGIYGGSIQRTVLAPDGSGISLWPDLYAEIIFKFIPGDSIELIIPVALDSESPFYRETSIFRGSRRNAGDFLAQGKWKCAPFDIKDGGWIDTVGTVDGTWRMIPQ